MSARKALTRLVRVEEGEGQVLFWSFAYFFFLLSSYYVIRPLRDAFGLSGEDALTWLYTGTLVGTFLANPILGALVSRYPRRVFIPIVYQFLVLNLLVFWGLLASSSGDRQIQIARVFFVWASVFNLFAVSVFWGFMADLFRSEQGTRLFGFIGMGGTLGAVAGAAVTAFLAQRLGPPQLLLIAAALLEAAIYCVWRLSRLASGPVPLQAAPIRTVDAEKPPGRGVLSGIRLVATSPYLLGICLFMLLYSISSTLIYFEQARIVRPAFPDTAARTAFFARVDLFVSLITLLLQAFFTGRVLQFVGVGGTLLALPSVTLAGFAAIAAAPVVSTLVALRVVRQSVEFAFVRPAREVLFTVVSREEKYTAKNLIDTFVYRLGDFSGAWLYRGLAYVSLGASTIALSFVPIAALWMLLAMFLGRRQAARARTPDAAS